MQLIYQRLCILGHHGAIGNGFIIIIIIIIYANSLQTGGQNMSICSLASASGWNLNFCIFSSL